MAGYSGTPLPKKLGIKSGHRVLLLQAPDGFEETTLVPLPDDVAIARSRRGTRPFDVIVLFVDRAARLERDFATEEQKRLLEDMTLTINGFFCWDFNSCEALLKDGVWHPIDYANACPDSQVTSLHYHFSWLVLAKIRWALFCAATGRRMRMNPDWRPYFDVVEKDPDMPLRERLAAFAGITRKAYEAERFEEFCAEHLGDLEEVTWEYFGTDPAKEAVRKKVQALFPEHEWDEFTDHFWNEIQAWREADAASRA